MPVTAVHIVRVITDDGEKQLWLAATSRDEAVDAVLEAIPEGWTASLIDRQLAMNAEVAAALDMSPGQVRRHRVS